MGSTKTADGKGAVAVETRQPDVTPTWIDPLDRLGLSDWFSRWPARFGAHWPERMIGDLHDIKIEEFTDDGDVVIRAEIPGVEPKDIEISVDRGRLTIRAEREERTESDDDEGYRSEFRYGAFARVLTLPGDTKVDDISASCSNGVLEVRVPTETVPHTPKKIPVSRS
jgi:HSP20 family protein